MNGHMTNSYEIANCHPWSSISILCPSRTFRVTMSIVNGSGRLVARLLSIRHSRKFVIESGEKDPILWEADFSPKHPNYLRRIPVAKHDAQFTKDVFEVYEKGITGPSVRRYALVLPLTAGPSQVIPILFILDTGPRVRLSLHLSCTTPDGGWCSHANHRTWVRLPAVWKSWCHLLAEWAML